MAKRLYDGSRGGTRAWRRKKSALLYPKKDAWGTDASTPAKEGEEGNTWKRTWLRKGKSTRNEENRADHVIWKRTATNEDKGGKLR
jgi:hypothetical protein